MKKIIAVILAVIMIMSLATVAFAANSFTDISNSKNKEAIETLDSVGVLTNANHWWAIYRVLTDLYGYDKNMRAFCKVVENMEASTTIKCDYNKWRNVNWANLTSRVDTWQGKSEMLSQAEQSQVKVAARLMELLA